MKTIKKHPSQERLRELFDYRDGKLIWKVTASKKDAADKQIRELQSEVKYDLRDFVIGYIVEQFQDDHFYIPDYQREYIWRDHHRWAFIESVLLGLPVPMMFVAEIEDDGRLEIVDGAQRMQTLEAFMNNDLELKKLKKLSKLNGFKYEDLPTGQQNKFRNKAMRVVVLDSTTTVETRKEIFRRINTSGEKATDSEIRKYFGTYDTIPEAQAARDKKLSEINKQENSQGD